MDVKVITRHTPSNYGSLLQCIAMIKCVERFGHQCEIIDYERKDERGLKGVLTHAKQKGMSGPKLVAYVLIRYIEVMVAQCKFDKMRHLALKMTSIYNTEEELKKLDADIFMTGSDQVWGFVTTGTYDPAYFFDFVTKGRKIAFSASFGKIEFEDGIIAAYKKYLSSYDFIAVREDSAVELLNSWGIPNLGQVLDPTLLLAAEDWREYEEKKYPRGKYVLIYQLHSNPEFDAYAQKFSERTGLPLYRVSPTYHQKVRGGKFIYLPDYGEFLSCIDHATYFLTDSFHGTSFALNFNTNFIDILPSNGTSSRNLSILHLTGLSDRILRSYDDFSLADNVIDWNRVNSILEEERKKSLEVLKEILS